MFVSGNFQKFIIFGLLSSLSLPKSSQGFNSVSVVVSPEKIVEGSNVTLHCLYMLEDPLYSLKWFYNYQEFFRYQPDGLPQLKFFPIANISILHEECNSTTVVLQNFRTLNNGNYTCEVSGDAPTFQLFWNSKNIKVFQPENQNHETTTSVPEVNQNSTVLFGMPKTILLKLFTAIFSD